MPANLYALGAIALWISLASLGRLLRQIPPFLLTGAALLGTRTKQATQRGNS